MTETPQRKPELCAPAGRVESFFAALDSGADAVYLGFRKFNARLRSENFSPSDLARLIPYAHERGKKVYIALNTLLKQTEIPEAVSLLSVLEKLEADAVILADMGLLSVARSRFPGLRLHLSTQAGVHSSAGAAAAERLGCARVILARELTAPELALIRKRTKLELEVFVHGALCYSFSGFCLASSYIGGMSGNRGLCTQVCRRAFLSGGVRRPFFSLYDIALLEAVPALVSLGIDAFKIEGRLKGASYVRTVVSAYRRAIDDHDAIPALKTEIEADLARKKTAYFFGSGERAKEEARPGSEEGSEAVGLFLGEVRSAAGTSMVIGPAAAVAAGDTVRIQPSSGFEGRRCKTAAVEKNAESTTLVFHHPLTALPGDRVYLVEKKGPPSAPPPALPPARSVRTLPPEKARALAESVLPQTPHSYGRTAYSVKIDCLEWLTPLQAAACDAARFIVSLDLEAGRRFTRVFASLPPALQKKIAVGFPLFMPETALEDFRRLADKLAAAGVGSFWAESLGAFELPTRGGKRRPIRFLAAPSLGALNAQARSLIRSLGADVVCSPLEDDFLNIRNSRRVPPAVVVYGFVPLFVSRVDPGLADGAALSDQNNNRFIMSRSGGCFRLVGREPVCLFQKLGKLESAGVREFIIDLSFIQPDESFLRGLLAAFRERKRLLPSTLFNFKRELA